MINGVREEGKAVLGSQEAALERLLREIAAVRNGIASDIATMRAHPTYGRTKTSIRRQINHLDGLLTAWAIVTGRWDKLASPMPSDVRHWALDVLGVDVDALAAAVL